MVLMLVVAGCARATPTPAPAATPTAPPAPPEEVTLDFVVWTYAIDMIQDNISKFEATAPGVKAILTDYDWGHYHDTVVTNFVAGTAVPDVLYGSDHWLQEWASAGWIVPLKEAFPADELDALAEDMFPYTLAGTVYNGELYGLAYYADPIAFIYNTRFYEEAGIEGAPETWEDVLEHSRIIKAAGLVDYPIGFGWSQQEPFSIEVVTAMLMSRGDEFFDDNLEPIFLDSDGNPIPNSTLEQHIEWVKTALDEGLMDPESLTRDGVVSGLWPSHAGRHPGLRHDPSLWLGLLAGPRPVRGGGELRDDRHPRPHTSDAGLRPLLLHQQATGRAGPSGQGCGLEVHAIFRRAGPR